MKVVLVVLAIGLTLLSVSKGAIRSGETCEHSGVPLYIYCGTGTIKIQHAAYGVYSNSNTCGRTYSGYCNAPSSLHVMRQRCEGKNYCAVPASNSVFGDPCYGVYKYLTATWECVTATSSGEACEHSGRPLLITCGSKRINIKHAVYGVHSNWNSCGRTHGGHCSASSSLRVMQQRCQGRHACAVPASNHLFGDPCGGVLKYLTATWNCY